MPFPTFEIMGLPFVFFMIGVVASDFLRLHAVPRLNLYVMGIVTGLFAVAFQVHSASYAVAGIGGTITKNYGFMQDQSSYMMFVSVLAFMGLSAPALFHELRRRFSTLPPEPQPVPSPPVAPQT